MDLRQAHSERSIPRGLRTLCPKKNELSIERNKAICVSLKEEISQISDTIKEVKLKINSVPTEIIDPVLTSREIEFKEKLVAINRITKVVKGGRRFGFAALVVVGNQKGSIGIGQGKSKQVPDAIKKATEVAKRNLIKIPLKEGRTLHHDVKGKNGSGKVFLRAAPAGTGIIAGGAIRSVCEVLGIQDVVAKSLGSANPHNVLKACVNGLKSQNSPKILSAIREKFS